MNDHQLIARFLIEKDHKDYEELVRRHQSNIRQFLRRLTVGDDSLADDLAQETFLIMYNKLETFRGAAKLSTWLHQIAYRCFLGYVRKNPGNQVEFIDTLHTTNNSSYRDSVETEVLILQLLKNLNMKERLVMTLAYSAGMSQSEIVAVSALPLGTVKSLMTRARQKLEKFLPENEEVA